MCLVSAFIVNRTWRRLYTTEVTGNFNISGAEHPKLRHTAERCDEEKKERCDEGKRERCDEEKKERCDTGKKSEVTKERGITSLKPKQQIACCFI